MAKLFPKFFPANQRLFPFLLAAGLPFWLIPQEVKAQACATGSVPGSVAGWLTQTAMPASMYQFATGQINSILYAVGGANATNTAINTLVSYNPVSNVWSTLASMPTARYHLGAGVVDGILYAVGGQDGSNNYLGNLEAYDPVKNSWSSKSGLPTACSGMAVVAVNETLYVIGGNNGSNLSRVYAYDPDQDQWTSKSNMPTARYGLQAGVVNGIIYAVGGTNGSPLGTVEAYNPDTDSWTSSLTSLTTARDFFSLSSLNGILYAAGGFNSSNLASNAVESYDPSKNHWTTQTSLSVSLEDLGGGAAGGNLYVFGGDNGISIQTGNMKAAFQCFTATPTATFTRTPTVVSCASSSAADLKWSSQSSLPTAREFLAADSMGGTVYVVGGQDSSGNFYNNLDLYNVSGGFLSPATPPFLSCAPAWPPWR